GASSNRAQDTRLFSTTPTQAAVSRSQTKTAVKSCSIRRAPNSLLRPRGILQSRREGRTRIKQHSSILIEKWRTTGETKRSDYGDGYPHHPCACRRSRADADTAPVHGNDRRRSQRKRECHGTAGGNCGKHVHESAAAHPDRGTVSKAPHE